MGRTACTEPQCLYSTAIPLLPLLAILPVQSLSACTVQLYLYSYWPYGLYRASVPVQCSYTSTPIGRTACTGPQCLYKVNLYPLHCSRSCSSKKSPNPICSQYVCRMPADSAVCHTTVPMPITSTKCRLSYSISYGHLTHKNSLLQRMSQRVRFTAPESFNFRHIAVIACQINWHPILTKTQNDW